MKSNFLPPVSGEGIKKLRETGDDEALYDLLTQPLHAELYRRKSFDFMDELSGGQQLFLAYDYVRAQAGQGGFIQLIQNGYVSLLPTVIEQLTKTGDQEMANVLDDVLKVYVLNRELLDKPATVQEFARLYDELKEFESIDARFMSLDAATIELMLRYAMAHLDEFVTV